MAGRYHTPGGWTVEVLQLPAGDRLRIRHHGFYVADVVNADDLARWIPAAELAQLERDTLILAASPRRPSFRFPAHAAACATPTNTPRPGTGRSDAPVPPAGQRELARSHTATSRPWSDGLNLTVDRMPVPSATIVRPLGGRKLVC